MTFSFNRYLRSANQWLLRTPERALDQAYDAALMIQAIEDQHFNGSKISLQPASQSGLASSYSPRILAEFQAELKKNLKIIDVRLKEFRASRTIVDSTNSTLYNRSTSYMGGDRDQSAATIEKLTFIDKILTRYKPDPLTSTALVPVAPRDRPLPVRPDPVNSTHANGTDAANFQNEVAINLSDDGILDKTGVLPRSIIGTLNRIKRDLDPDSEQTVVRDFRITKAKTRISIRLILLLIVIPLLTQQLSKTFVIGPLVDAFWKPNQNGVFLNFELEEEALREFNKFKERLEFDRLIGLAPALSEQSQTEQEELYKEKAQEIAASFGDTSSGAIKNVFSDLLSVGAFVIVLLTNRPELEVLKGFIDETVYGLSDSAKAFVIILFTDIFVGFHSPHGWEVLLETLAKHLGLPASRDFIFLFIATFPVILDTVFKYWIFRYLNRVSPSAVATYKNMNE
jgi:hypothetical protein